MRRCSRLHPWAAAAPINTQCAFLDQWLPCPTQKHRAPLTCSGQGSNQSITVLLTRPGKLRQWLRSVSPTGLMASTTCRLDLTLSTKAAQQASRLSGRPCCASSALMELIRPSFSESLYRAGTMPTGRHGDSNSSNKMKHNKVKHCQCHACWHGSRLGVPP